MHVAEEKHNAVSKRGRADVDIHAAVSDALLFDNECSRRANAPIIASPLPSRQAGESHRPFVTAVAVLPTLLSSRHHPKSSGADAGLGDTITNKTARATRQSVKSIPRALHLYQTCEFEKLYQALAVTAIDISPISVMLAKTRLGDSLVIAVSGAFEQLTGYCRSDMIGHDCRILNKGCHMPSNVRDTLRNAVREKSSFAGIITNRRKNLELFENMLNMCTIRVGSSLFAIAFQQEVVKDHDVKRLSERPSHALEQMFDDIFSQAVDAWMSTIVGAPIQAGYLRDLVIPGIAPGRYTESREAFVCTHVKAACLRERNTFLELEGGDQEEGEPARPSAARRCSSSPAVLTSFRLDRDGRARRNSGGITAVSLIDAARWMTASTQGNVSVAKAQVESAINAVEVDASKRASSLGHPMSCNPCIFHCYSASGCNRGDDCIYCHMDHKRKSRKRGQKKGRPVVPEGDELEDLGIAKADLSDDCYAKAKQSWICMPLLEALELLSPLPLPVGLQATVFFQGSNVEGACQSISAGDAVSFRYSQEVIVMCPGDSLHVLPFLRAQTTEVRFSIEPKLPGEFSLNSRSGLIKGTARALTDPAGGIYKITASIVAGASISTSLRVLVVTRAVDDISI